MCKNTGSFEEWFTLELWDTGNVCLEKCNEFVELAGPGCCEARPRPDGSHISTDHTSYCRFYPNGQIDTGFSDTKAVLCNEGIFEINSLNGSYKNFPPR